MNITYDKDEILNHGFEHLIREKRNTLSGALVIYEDKKIPNKKWVKEQILTMIDQYGSNAFQKLFDEINELKKVKLSYKESEQFKKDIIDVKTYIRFIKKDIEKSSPFEHLREIVRVDLPTKFTILIFPRRLSCGRTSPDENIIRFGHTEDWKHYTIVYICHEILHLLIPDTTFVVHAIIELCTDYHLRIIFNKYKNINTGHPRLLKYRKEILPYFMKYVKSQETIFQFIDEMHLKFGKKQEYYIR
jgi:hypothetical protein